jgi:hypothetical protein
VFPAFKKILPSILTELGNGEICPFPTFKYEYNIAKYIYGIKKPSEARKKEIENALHTLGKKLLAVQL